MRVIGRAAIFVEPNKPLVVDEVEFPDPGPDQVLVKLFSSGVCHSQLHTMGRPPRPGHRLPALLGHESTGVVAAKGAGVKHVKEGDHVITTWVDRDNSTTTQPRVAHALNDRTQYSANWKGKEVMHSAATWAEYALAQDRVVLPLPKDVPTDVTSVIGCAVMTGAGAIINTLQVRPGQSVAVFGAGGIGLCAIAAAAIADAHPIIAVDVIEDKLAFARRFGATHTVNARDSDVVKVIDPGTNTARRQNGTFRVQQGWHGIARWYYAAGSKSDSRYQPVHRQPLLHAYQRRRLSSRPRLSVVYSMVPRGQVKTGRTGNKSLHAGSNQRGRR